MHGDAEREFTASKTAGMVTSRSVRGRLRATFGDAAISVFCVQDHYTAPMAGTPPFPYHHVGSVG